MELCTGGELLDKIIKQGYIREDEAKIYMKNIFSAINYCHKLNISHRDLKPDNFLLKSNDPNAEVKVVDFGLSKEINDNKFATNIGTAYYVAPEVLSGKYTYKCDIWSLGVCL